MSSKMIRQVAFTAGQADQVTWKRTDDPSYLTAAQSLLNTEIGTTGLAKKRKGTTFLQDVTGEAVFNSTMYEFIDKNGNYYLILGGDRNFYVYGVPEPETEIITYNSLFVTTYTGAQVVANDTSLTLVQVVPADYTSSDLFELDYTQDNDSLIFTSPNYRPGRLYVDTYSPAVHFSFEYLDIYPLPSYDFNTINYNNTTVALSTSGGGGLGTLTITFSGLPVGSVYTNAWIGGQIIGGGVSDLAPIGYAIITAVNQVGLNVTFTATVQIAFQTTAYPTAGSQYSIRQPAWVNQANDPFRLGYPAKVLYFQNRLWFANTRLLPTTVFGSKLNQPISFDVGTGKDTDAIIYTIGQTNTGAIQWMNGGKQLEIFCSNLEFACPQNEDVGLTPSTFSVRQQSSYGSSSRLKPQTYINDSYFMQKTGKSIINFHFTGVGLSYQSTNVAPQSQQLMKNPVNRALLRGTDTSQDNFIYLMNDSDDTITTFQFASEIKLAALTPMVFQDNVQLIDICTVDNYVYILKYYTLTGVFSIERLDTGVFIDSSENYYMNFDGSVTGLQRFNGYRVQVVYQNQDYGQYNVVNGEITVDNPLGYSGQVQVGLLYNVEIKPMYPFYGSTAAPFEKQVNRVYIDYYNSLNFFINGSLVQYQSFYDIQNNIPLSPKTDTAIFSPVSGYSRFDAESIVITQSSPFDLQILGIAYQIEMAVI